jgi:hypothetical protein
MRAATAVQLGPRVRGIGSRAGGAGGEAGSLGAGGLPQPIHNNDAPNAARSWCSVM